MTYNTYIFDNFSYVDKLITIPKSTIFYRGISGGKHLTDEQILRSGKPMYIASEDIAKAYCGNPENDRCVQFITKDNLYLLDLRKIILLLPSIIDTIPYIDNNIALVNTLKITLGISSLDEQIQLLQITDSTTDNRYKKIPKFINSGIRIPVTDLDATMVVILSLIFKNYCDGIIAPKLNSPFEVSGRSHQEIILFDSIKLQIIDNIIVKKIDINLLLNKKPIKFMNFTIYQGGHFIEDRNKIFDKNLKQIITKSKQFVKNIKFDMPFEKIPIYNITENIINPVTPAQFKHLLKYGIEGFNGKYYR
jgi:hypothetical protein